jgi:hypothetical protein
MKRFVNLKPRRTIISLSLSVLLLNGCSSPVLQPEPISLKQATAIQLPEMYRNQPAPIEEVTPTIWWKALDNEELNQLIDRALGNSPDLRIATVQMVEAKIRADQVTAGGSPTLTAPIQIAGQVPGGTVGNIPVGGSNRDVQRTLQTSLAARWRLDMWGERKALQESADLQFWRSVYERENAQRILLASVTTTYIGYLSANDMLRLAHDEEKLAAELLSTVEQKFLLEDATLDQVEQARVQLYALQAAVPGYEQQREEARNNLAFLVGAIPQNFNLTDQGLDSISAPGLPKTLPSTLITERPDIRLIEARLKGAHADINAARARLLPPVDLISQTGFSGLGPSQLLQSNFFFWNIIGSLTATLFDGGARDLDKAASQMVYQEMVETYARTVLQSIKEVESALTNLRISQEKLKAQMAVVSVSFKITNTTQQAYELGAVEFGNILDAQKSYRLQLIAQQQQKAELLKAYVSLYQALGAGVAKGLGENLQPIGIEPDSIVFANNVLEENNNTNHKQWEVALFGVYDRSVIPALWRDLNHRFSTQLEHRALHVYLGDQVKVDQDAITAWYRLAITGFNSEEQAKDLCNALQAQQQSCFVVSAHSPMLQTQSTNSWWPW